MSMDDDNPGVTERSDEELELAAYLDELVSATRVQKACGADAQDRATKPPPPIAPEPAPSGRHARGMSNAWMREELLALFRDTQQKSTVPAASAATTAEPGSPAPAPSVFLRRFLDQAARSPELAPSGVVRLDACLDGGFGAGAHLVTGRPGVGKTAFLESTAWEAISSERPVLYYVLKEGSIGAWVRLVSTLGIILGGPSLPLSAPRTSSLAPDDLETLTRLDLAFQASVMPYLSLVETIPAPADSLRAFLGDVRSRAQVATQRHGRTPLLLVDDLECLLLPSPARPLTYQLSRLNDTLIAESMPGLFAMTPTDEPAGLDRLPASTLLELVPVPPPAPDGERRVDLQVRTNSGAKWTGTLPLLVHPSGLFADRGA